MLSYIPVLGRLRPADYLRLFLGFLFLVTEPLLRFIFAIVTPLRHAVDWIRSYVGPALDVIHDENGQPIAESDDEDNGEEGKKTAIEKAERILEGLNSTEDFVRFWYAPCAFCLNPSIQRTVADILPMFSSFRGFPFQHHYVTSKDGYILALHRIPYSRRDHDEKKRERAQARRDGLRHAPRHAPSNRPVVLLWHGFLMCSEVWVCTPDPKLSLAYTLADAGYDVWLGNTRGNKYSCKHRNLKPTEEAFWDFSMDHLALYDLPDAVDYILKVTGVPSLSYIGFSQGTAQGFSSLSINPRLNKRVNLFVALAPAAKPMGLENKTLGTVLNLSPEIIFLLFGKKSLLAMALFWQSILSPLSFAWMIDAAIYFLFKWSADMIDHKNVVYQHLYSYTSVKCVVHWFQIIRNGRFQMYDESPTLLPHSASGHVVPKFPTEHIQTPIALFYGGKDTLADMDWLLSETATPVYCLKVDEYEHLCFLWARGLDKTVYPAVLGLLHEYAETWADPNTSSVAVEPATISTVPWISEKQIASLLDIGKGHLDADGGKVVLDGRISANRMLKAQIARPTMMPRVGTWSDGVTQAHLAHHPLRHPQLEKDVAAPAILGSPAMEREQEELLQAALLKALKVDKSHVNTAPLVAESGRGGGRHPVVGRRASFPVHQQNGDYPSPTPSAKGHMTLPLTRPWNDASPLMSDASPILSDGEDDEDQEREVHQAAFEPGTGEAMRVRMRRA
ncbi:cholesterol esterase [Thoreauomyces humboldtii]|nr:cholesterol esterase [Thoreauomyces humboldtii]